MGNDKPEDIGPLSLSMVSLKRTGRGEQGTLQAKSGLAEYVC